MTLDYRVRTRMVLNLVFDVKTPIHIGYGQEGQLKKIVMLRYGSDYVPLIPCESLKGALRSLASKIAKSMNFSGITRTAVELHNKDTHIPSREEEKGEVLKFLGDAEKWLSENVNLSKRQVKELPDMKKIDLYLASNCPICTLFGSPGFSSKMNLYDAIPNGSWRILTLTSTSISRKTKTVEEKRLYSYQLVAPSPNLTYNSKAIIDNLQFESYDGKLFINLLKYLGKYGIQVGGLKSKGYGHIVLNTESSTYKFVDFNLSPKNDDEIRKNVELLLMKDLDEVSVAELLKRYD